MSWAVALPAAEISADDLEFFEAKIRPILVDACYKCHSAEAGKSKGDLLLDTKAALAKGGATGAAIVPGDPDKSLLIQAVRHTDADLKMPPEDEGGKLKPEQVALLEEWVRRGAPDPRTGGKPHPLDLDAARRHWAFQPVTAPAVPGSKNGEPVRTPVDAFVFAKLAERNLAPGPEADRRTLLRRVTFDLTGLPPTAAETDAFLADPAPDAYDRVVERLLASPRYGERWGRFWLDVARYADTKGYLAGNVERRYAFSHTYRDYVIRAFNADLPFDRFIVEQVAADRVVAGEDKSPLAALGFLTLGRRFLNNQNDIIDDRIDVVTRGLMGLTVACARCHDHKFDPVSAKDYYALHGIFASSEEPAEKPLLGPLADTPAYRDFLAKQAAVEKRIAAREAEEVERFLAGIRTKSGDYLLGAHEAEKLPADAKFDLFAGSRKLNVEVLKRWQALLKAPATASDPVLEPWLVLSKLAPGNFAAEAAARIAAWAGEKAGGKINAAILAELRAEGKTPAAPKDVAEAYNRAFARVDKAWQAALAEAEKAKTPAPTALPEPADEALRGYLYGAEMPPALAYAKAAEMIRRQINDKTSPIKRELEALNWTEPGAPLRAMALADKAKPANSRVFLRGNPANKGPEAPRQFLAILAGEKRVPFTDGSGRLELARAIADPANPLTARVFVNRVWGWHFGEALVRTPSDFGVRTAEPVQRALLDWLAADFVAHGWSVKHLHRRIVLAHTYRQSGDVRPAAAAADPENLLVHRYPRRRLEFEALRDSLLAAAGTLDLQAGGLPEELTRPDGGRRRTVYGFIDRQNLPGMFRTFDYPNPDTSTAQRFATTVPQQALFMLNSPFVAEQARRLLAVPEIVAARGDAAKITALYRRLYQRQPDAEELAAAAEFVARPMGAAAPAAATGGWTLGYGEFDEIGGRVADFKALMVRKGGRMLPADAFPSPDFHFLSLDANGGHPGAKPGQAAIRRWTAPVAGTVKINATLGHAEKNGDGVRGRIVSSRAGVLGDWNVKDRKQATKLESVAVAAGETLDFVVEAKANQTSDTFTWAPVIELAPADAERGDDALPVRTSWSAKGDFDSPAGAPAVRLTRWEELAQVLLLANEFVFVD